MPWPRNEPDPLETRRRQLAEQERLLSEQRRQLTEKLRSSDLAAAKRAEPPVWRMEDDSPAPRTLEPSAARRRNLGRQRQNDMILFFVFIAVLLIVGIVLWVVYVHSTTAINGT
jgi:hypothetical protein